MQRSLSAAPVASRLGLNALNSRPLTCKKQFQPKASSTPGRGEKEPMAGSEGISKTSVDARCKPREDPYRSCMLLHPGKQGLSLAR
eukprot:scaffold78096_cov22-Tisochrysis_lutea.AAC.5